MKLPPPIPQLDLNLQTSRDRFDQRMKRYVESMQLKRISTRIVKQHTLLSITKWNWPATNNGTKYDRTIAVERYVDGSLLIYLDEGGPITIETSIYVLRRMVQA